MSSKQSTRHPERVITRSQHNLLVGGATVRIKVDANPKLRLTSLTQQPGCYLFANAREQILYVGKAKNLQKRVSSYFHKSQNQRTAALLAEVTTISTFVCASEKEALILEYNLIKNHHPKFNVLLKDDKRFPYIAISNERHPRYLYTRRPVNNALFYYGPLPDGSKARQLLQILQEIIPLRRCRSFTGKPCFYFQLHRCLGACFQPVAFKQYEGQIQKVKAFFAAQDTTITRELTRRMTTAAQKLQFEQASKIKHLIQRLDWIRSDQQARLATTLDADFITCRQAQQRVVVLVLFYRQGCLIHKDFTIFDGRNTNANFLTRMFLLQLYHTNPLPSAIIIDHQLSLRDLQLIWPARVHYARTRAETKILHLAQQNAVNTLNTPHHLPQVGSYQPQLQQLQTLTGSTQDLYLIEMFDVSSWADKLVVGSCAVFKNGLLHRRDCRCYRTTVVGNDDYQAMGEIITKHYAHQQQHQRPQPDLLVVDGGWAHVRVAQKALRQLHLTLPVIGLSKDDRHHTETLVTSTGQHIQLQRHPALWRWLAGLQQLTHELGVSYFHKLKIKGLKTNLLVQLKGISSQKAQQLYAQFHDLPTMAQSNFYQLNHIIKNQTVTHRLMAFLNTRYKANLSK